MADRLQIAPRQRRILEDLLREHLPGVDVWAYGSRVNGRGHDGSDLDLVLRGPDLQELPAGQLLDFEDAIRGSNIPFLVEARDWACLPERFHRESRARLRGGERRRWNRRRDRAGCRSTRQGRIVGRS